MALGRDWHDAFAVSAEARFRQERSGFFGFAVDFGDTARLGSDFSVVAALLSVSLAPFLTLLFFLASPIEVERSSRRRADVVDFGRSMALLNDVLLRYAAGTDDDSFGLSLALSLAPVGIIRKQRAERQRLTLPIA